MTQYSTLVMLELFGSREVKWEKSKVTSQWRIYTLILEEGVACLKKVKQLWRSTF